MKKCHLGIIGEGNDKKYLSELTTRLNIANKVTFYGYCNNPRDRYMNSDLYILSSRYEGVSNSMLEALSVGLPVLAVTDKTSADEFIIDGFNGFTVNKCNEQSLYEGLIKATINLNSLDRKKIMEDAMEKYSIDKMVSKYKEILVC